jgi:hypothetical protein
MPWDACVEVFGSKMEFLTVRTVITRHGEHLLAMASKHHRKGVFTRHPTRLGELLLAIHMALLAMASRQWGSSLFRSFEAGSAFRECFS